MLVLTLLSSALFAGVFASRCDEGYRYSPHSGKCYRFFDKDTSWALAEFKCFFAGGHHISVHSYYDNQFARELARGSKTLWLGNAQFGKSVEYVWTDHTPYNWESWPHGVRPQRISGRQCTKMNVETGEWFQSCCKVPSPFICQKDPDTVSPYDDYYSKSNSNSNDNNNSSEDDSTNNNNNNNDQLQKYGKASEFRQRFFL